MRRASAFLTGVLLLFTLSACETEQAEIEPAPGVEQAEGMMGAAVTDVAGIHMTVQPDAWTGDAPISEEVTPLRVQIENGSGSPLEVQYPHFTLVTSEGEVYAALPPFAVEGEVAEPVLMQEYDPIEEPFFDYDAFGVYPYYTPVYPGVAAYDADFDYDPDYYVEYYTYWEDVELPTAEMLQHAPAGRRRQRRRTRLGLPLLRGARSGHLERHLPRRPRQR